MQYRRWASIHRTIGLALLLHWALLALTGVALVFHRDIEQRLLTTSSNAAQTVSLDAVAHMVSAARPNVTIQQISTLNGGMSLLRVRVTPDDGSEARSIVVDASKNIIVGDSPLSGSWQADGALQFVYRLHQTLLLGDQGKTLVAISGLFLTFMVVAGYRLLWPQRRNWRRVIRPKLAGNPRQKMTMLHRAVGVMAGPFLIVLAISGVGMNWTPPIKSAFIQVGLADPPPSPLADAKQGLILDADDAFAVAQRRFPAAQFTSISFPKAGSAIYVVRLRQPREVHATFGMTNVLVNGSTGDIQNISDPRPAKAGDKILEWLFAVHNGEFLNLPGRILVLLIGFALLGLCLLGGAAWLRTPSRRKGNSA